MSRILIVGATGYIGQHLAQELLRSGNHEVWGIARSPEKAKTLAQNEIIPVVFSAANAFADPDEFVKTVNENNIDVVVACGADRESFELFKAVKLAGQQRIEAYADAGVVGSKLGFLYTSGTWVHGTPELDLINSASNYCRALRPVSDLDPVGDNPLAPNPPANLVGWRTKLEQDILNSRDVLDVAIVRPVVLYGRPSTIWTQFLGPVVKAAREGKENVVIPLKGAARPSLVHVDDVASGLALAVEKIHMLSGTGELPVFNLAGQTESMREIFNAFAAVVRYKGEIEFAGPSEDLFADAVSTSQNIHSGRAKSVLGWQPKRLSFVQGMYIYAKAFEAAMDS